MRTKTDPKVSAEELISESGLSPQQSLFVAEYLIDQNATAAAERAGYSDPNYGRQLLTNPNVKRAIDSQLVASVSRTTANADEVLEKMWQLATFDANEISQYRRGACRHCWGFGHHYQWRDSIEHDEKCEEAKARTSRNHLTRAAMATTTTGSLTQLARGATVMELGGRISRIHEHYPVLRDWLTPARRLSKVVSRSLR